LRSLSEFVSVISSAATIEIKVQRSENARSELRELRDFLKSQCVGKMISLDLSAGYADNVTFVDINVAHTIAEVLTLFKTNFTKLDISGHALSNYSAKALFDASGIFARVIYCAM
jgi:hypothetical protein